MHEKRCTKNEFMKNALPIVGTLKKPFNLALFTVVGLLFFGVNYYALANLPSSNGFMCSVGGNLNPTNILFSLILSGMAGLIVAGLWEQVQEKKSGRSVKIGSTSSLGLGLGTLTSFCTLCTLPVISLFGVGSILTFISEYQLHFKLLSIAILGAGVYLLNNQLRKRCNLFCKLKK